MNKRIAGVMVSCLVAAMMAVPGYAALQVGAAAPDFTATASQAGKDFTFSLKQALAKGPVVVYFYPAAYTGRDREGQVQRGRGHHHRRLGRFDRAAQPVFVRSEILRGEIRGGIRPGRQDRDPV